MAAPFVGTSRPLDLSPFGSALSANSRYLIDQYGNPWLLSGDSSAAFATNLSASDQATVLSTKSSQGFNTMWCVFVSEWANGLNGNVNGAMYDGTLAFTGTIPSTSWADLTTPNPAYWSRIDASVALAESYGITLLCTPMNCANYPFAGNPSWSMNSVSNNSSASCTTFGKFLGARYKNATNVIWWHGNDYQPAQANNDDTNLQAMISGIRSMDGRHLHTMEALLSSGGTGNYSIAAGSSFYNLLNINHSYPGGNAPSNATYTNDQNAYAASPTMPMFMGEGQFEDDAGGSEFYMRSQAWWAMVVGAFGAMFGSNVPVNGGTSVFFFPSGWQSFISSTGSTQMGYWQSFWSAIRWWTLAPDTANGAGHLVNSGFSSGSTQAWGAKDPIGSLAVIYVPTNGPIVIDLTKMRGSVTAQWYDPTAGTYSSAGSGLSNGGTHSFTSPSAHSDGAQDYALLLTA